MSEIDTADERPNYYSFNHFFKPMPGMFFVCCIFTVQMLLHFAVISNRPHIRALWSVYRAYSCHDNVSWARWSCATAINWYSGRPTNATHGWILFLTTLLSSPRRPCHPDSLIRPPLSRVSRVCFHNKVKQECRVKCRCASVCFRSACLPFNETHLIVSAD